MSSWRMSSWDVTSVTALGHDLYEEQVFIIVPEGLDNYDIGFYIGLSHVFQLLYL